MQDADHPQSAAETPLTMSRPPSRWKELWPVYCVGIGIVLILVGALG